MQYAAPEITKIERANPINIPLVQQKTKPYFVEFTLPSEMTLISYRLPRLMMESDRERNLLFF